jgi:hypothetical protein
MHNATDWREMMNGASLYLNPLYIPSYLIFYPPAMFPHTADKS